VSAKRVRVFATPSPDGSFRACITDADGLTATKTPATLFFGSTKQPSLAAALRQARDVAGVRGWQVVAAPTT
jgi:hypothetical protein